MKYDQRNSRSNAVNKSLSKTITQNEVKISDIIKERESKGLTNNFNKELVENFFKP